MNSPISFYDPRHPVVLPSMLLCDFGNLQAEVARLERAGFRALHLDVMDGVFVPNLSYGLTIVRAFRQVTRLPLDVHLMIADPLTYAGEFRRAGADAISFHVEAVADPRPVVDAIRATGAAVGIALNPDTPTSRVADVVPDVDFVLLMTVQAGFGGQSFQPGPLAKIAELRRLREDLVIEVDGGINRQTVRQCTEAGGDLLVAGSAIFHSDDYELAHRQLNEEMVPTAKS